MLSWEKPLTREFFAKETTKVARGLLGCYLVHDLFPDMLVGQIVETEAYLGEQDPACHSARGKTPRNAVMFGPAGMSYVYLIYGIYYCFNVTTAAADAAEAVLIRALKPIMGIEYMKRQRNKNKLEELCSGPAKLVQAMAIGPEHNGIDLTKGNLYFCPGELPGEVKAGSRVGISKAADWPLRFFVAGSPFVSKKN